MKGADFAAALLAHDPPKGETDPTVVEACLANRQRVILEAVDGGSLFVPDWTPIDVIEKGHSARVFAANDAFAVGDASDYVRFEVSAELAQAICDRLGLCLSTPKVEDLAWRQAQVRLEPQLMPASPEMSWTAYMLEYNRRVEAARANRFGLTRTVGKAWVLCKALDEHPLGDLGAVNYGFHTRAAANHETGPYRSPYGFDLVLWQNVGTRHNRKHTDESQVFCPLLQACVVDGEASTLQQLLRDPERAYLVSYDGPLKNVRQRGVPLGEPA